MAELEEQSKAPLKKKSTFSEDDHPAKKLKSNEESPELEIVQPAPKPELEIPKPKPKPKPKLIQPKLSSFFKNIWF